MTTEEKRLSRIVLVNPPFSYFPQAGRRSFNYARPPLGLAYLAASLQQKLGSSVEVRIIDCIAEKIGAADELEKILLAAAPDVVGFSVVTATRDIAGEMAVRLHTRLPNCRVVLGGPHITALPDEPAPGVDAIFVGEGEESLAEYVRRAVPEQRREPIDGCIQLLPGGEKLRGGECPFIDPLDRVPMPAIDLLPREAYLHSYPHRYRRFMTMLTSRGCPFGCRFCANEFLWKSQVRFFSVERVTEEIDRLAGRFGVDLVFIEDDTFLARPDRAVQIMRYIRDRQPGMKWICHTRADTITPELADEMAASRCVEVQIGAESGSAAVLRETNKKLELADIRRAFALLKKTQIRTWATFIVGNPGETPENVEETIRFAIEIDPTYSSFIMMLPFPGTRTYDLYRQKGFITAKSWSEYSWHGKPVFATDTLSHEQLVNLRRKAYRRFFLRPSKLLRTFVDVLRANSVREIWRAFWYWYSLAR